MDLLVNFYFGHFPFHLDYSTESPQNEAEFLKKKTRKSGRKKEMRNRVGKEKRKEI